MKGIDMNGRTLIIGALIFATYAAFMIAGIVSSIPAGNGYYGG